MNAILLNHELRHHKLTLGDYLILHEQGRFEGCGKIELLDGEIYVMSPQSRRHVIAKNELGWRIRNVLAETGSQLSALIEPTVQIEPGNAPEPDIIVYDPARVDQAGSQYFAADPVILAIEVSVSTLATDLEFKRQLYASAGIKEYWVLDINHHIIHQFWLPLDGDYVEKQSVPIGTPIKSLTISDLKITTDGLI